MSEIPIITEDCDSYVSTSSSDDIPGKLNATLIELQTSGGLANCDIKAMYSDGEVTLQGTFGTLEQQQNVFSALQQIEGVKKINHTTQVADVGSNPSPRQTISQLSASGSLQNNQWKIIRAETGFAIWIIGWICFFINIFTLGLAVPFTTVMYYQQWASNVMIDGRRLRFTGTAGGLLGVWLSTLILSIITLGLYWIFIGKGNVARWVDSNLSWA